VSEKLFLQHKILPLHSKNKKTILYILYSMEQSLYPLKFMPLFKNKIWGGNKLKDMGVNYSPLPNCGELWTLSDLEGQETLVQNGYLAQCTLNEVLEMYADELVGEKCFKDFGTTFPLLFKIIDAADKLSIQVHPDNNYAYRHKLGNGKTEMWYVIDADPISQIISGFNQKVGKAQVINRVRDNNLIDILNSESVEKGDVFFVDAGTVHALGKGCMVAEIQQSSDCTFRLYDWDRVDKDGKKRQLHVENALNVLDYTPVSNSAKTHYHCHINETVELVECPYFTTNLLHLTQGLQKDYSMLDSFVAYQCVEGSGFVNCLGQRIPIKQAEVMLLPAITDLVTIEPNKVIKLLEVYL